MKRFTLGITLLALVGCSGGSNSGGNHEPGKAICSACTYGSECESGRCVKFTSGIWRCVPQDAGPGYRCPSGMYSLESCE